MNSTEVNYFIIAAIVIIGITLFCIVDTFYRTKHEENALNKMREKWSDTPVEQR